MPPRRSQAKAASPEELPSVEISGVTAIGTEIKLVTYEDRYNNQNIPAVYHDDYRHVWIAQNDTTEYIHGRKSGHENADITCYYEAHHAYGPNRKDWPDILFQFEAAKKPRSQRDEHPDWLFTQEGWLVIDYKSHPVHDYKMPLTLSSLCEGYLMEVIMRENHHERIGVQDLLARMPGKIDANGKEPRRIGTISMRMNRFRRDAGCITWEPKVGSDAIKRYLEKLLPPHCIQANSTRDFRNLFPHEKAEIETINAGLFPNKARQGKKDFSEEHQQKKLKEAQDKRQRKRTEFERRSCLHEPLSVLDDNIFHPENYPSLKDDSKAGEHLMALRTEAIRNTTDGWAAAGSPTVDNFFQDDLDPMVPSSDNDIRSDTLQGSSTPTLSSSSDTAEDFHIAPMVPSSDTLQGSYTPTLPSSSDATEATDSDTTLSQVDYGMDIDELEAYSDGAVGDIRHIEPMTDNFNKIILAFIEPTVYHYQFLTGELAPQSHEVLTYQEYYEFLSEAFEAFARATHLEEFFEGVKLIGLDRLTMDFVSFNFKNGWDTGAFGQPLDVQGLLDLVYQLVMSGEIPLEAQDGLPDF